MSNTLTAIISGPSLVKERWLSLKMAVWRVVDFEQLFGSQYLFLACHAALPLLLTPELLNLIRVNFLDENAVPFVAESDFLLSSLCRQIDDGLFEVEPSVREVLLVILENQLDPQRPLEIANFLFTYLTKKANKKQSPLTKRVQYWVALAYLEPDLVVEEMSELLKDSLSLDKTSFLEASSQNLIAIMVDTLEIIAKPLGRTQLQEKYVHLMYDTRILAQVLYGYQQVERYSEVSPFLSESMREWLSREMIPLSNSHM